MQIAVVIPAYEEAENLEILLPEIHEAVKKTGCEYTITVVDSLEKTDNTEQVCQQNQVVYLPRKGGNNYGDAIRTGIGEADGDYIVIMDADGSHDPKDIIRLYEEAKKGFDIVIGSRYIEGGDTHNGFILKAMSLTVNYAYRFVFRLKVKDVSNSFRIYETAKLKELCLSCDNFDIVEEILILLVTKHKDIKIAEIPIYFDKRVYGKTKRDLFRFILSYIVTMSRLYRIKKRALKSL
jgi:dolichol-phosphate mannosyltransferase